MTLRGSTASGSERGSTPSTLATARGTAPCTQSKTALKEATASDLDRHRPDEQQEDRDHDDEDREQRPHAGGFGDNFGVVVSLLADDVGLNFQDSFHRLAGFDPGHHGEDEGGQRG